MPIRVLIRGRLARAAPEAYVLSPALETRLRELQARYDALNSSLLNAASGPPPCGPPPPK